jgi:hypothetical protein
MLFFDRPVLAGWICRVTQRLLPGIKRLIYLPVDFSGKAIRQFLKGKRFLDAGFKVVVDTIQAVACLACVNMGQYLRIFRLVVDGSALQPDKKVFTVHGSG